MEIKSAGDDPADLWENITPAEPSEFMRLGGRAGGKVAESIKRIGDARARSEHVHVALRSGTRCAGGDPDCTLDRVQPPYYGMR